MPTTPEAAILCGGLGTRLAGLGLDVPKAMIPVGGRPFLVGLVDAVTAQGVRRIVLCTGQGGEQIRAYFTGRDCGAGVVFSEETEPLGTGGALRLALPLLAGEFILVLNGDSWAPFDLAALTARQRETGAEIVLLTASADGREDAGSLRLDAEGHVQAFAEKQPVAGARLLNAGIYLLRRRVIEAILPGRAVSLEREILPSYLDGRMVALPARGPLVDIGTPGRLTQAQALGDPFGSDRRGSDP